MGAGKNRTSKGVWLGMPMYNLTLEERVTCPTDCPQWEDCYGNNMPWAHRFEAGEALESAITHDVEYLSGRHTDGFIVRLHVLGDFYSVGYVRHWLGLVDQYPQLHVFGYTHRAHSTDIGKAISEGRGARFRIMRSDPGVRDDPLPAAWTLPVGEVQARADSVVCPWYSGKTESCLTCGLCWNGRTNVSFIRH